MPMQLNIACWVTLSRLLLLPAALSAAWLPGLYGPALAAALCLLAGLTDILDGYLARRKECVTPLGSFLDPLADKLFVSSMLVTLACRDLIPSWVPGIVIFRELIISLVRIRGFRQGLSIESNLWGKLKMVASMMAIILLLMAEDLSQRGVLANIGAFSLLPMVLGLSWWALWLALALTIVSGASYLYHYSGLDLDPRKALPARDRAAAKVY